VKKVKKEINILGLTYSVEEVEVVNKEDLRKGEIDFFKGLIKIDQTMSKTQKEQVLMHEILHAVLETLGFHELNDNEHLVQSLATALHQVFTAQTIFS
jgi:Zn-dependent peptidase ImmA (M78 family)